MVSLSINYHVYFISSISYFFEKMGSTRAATLLLVATWLVTSTECLEEEPLCSEAKLGLQDELKCKGGFAWNCSHLNLKQIPTRFPMSNSSQKLCELNLSWNRLTSVEDNSFRTLKDLKWLRLNNNNLTRIESNAFVGLQQLVYLNLSTNKLDCKSFTDQVFEPLVRLKYLNLKKNPIQTYEDLDTLLHPLRNTLEGLLISGCYNCSFGQGFENFHNLKYLCLSGFWTASGGTECNFNSLSNDTFTHVPRVEELFLAFCNISVVESGALSPLKHIKILDISYNPELHFSGMRNVFNGLINSTICILDVSAIHEQHERGTELLREHVEPIQYMKNLKVLYMELNKLEVINETVFDLIPSSTSHFMLAGNRLTYGKYVEKLSNMKHIKTMDLSRQHLNYDPFLQKHQEHLYNLPIGARLISSHRRKDTPEWQKPTCKGFSPPEVRGIDSFQFCTETTDGTMTEKAENTDIAQLESSSTYGDAFSCLLCTAFCPQNMTCICAPENLKYLYWRASFVYFHITALKVCLPNSLQVLNMSFNLLEEWHGPVLGLENLRELNLAENMCYLMSPYFLDNFTSLLRLNISFNNLGESLDPEDRNAGQHFKNLKKLQVLAISGNYITGLAANIFEHMTELRNLSLGRNLMTQWNATLNTKCLQMLDLSHNKIESLPEQFRNYLDETARLPPEQTCNRSGNLTLRLNGNPIQCNCDNRPFLRWLYRSPVDVHFDNTDECHLTDGSRLKLLESDVIQAAVERLDRDCVPYVWIGVSIGIFVVSILLCIAAYRHRWKLRHLYYSSRRRYKHTGYSRLFDRDAFISYAQTEAAFIKDKLVPSLEGDHGLKVWVADRDALAGASVAENLTHAIYESKKSVFILSRQYFVESWCNYEMNMARIESIESQRKLMIVVLYEDISGKEMPLDYLRLLKSVQCMEYPKHPQNLDTFWTSLAQSIQEE